MSALWDVLQADYPSRNHALMEYLQKINMEGNLKNWKDFALALSFYFNEDNMTVTKSSTWAVCQDLLGNLSGQDLMHARSRGGIWTCDPPVSVREILTRFSKEYPSV